MTAISDFVDRHLPWDGMRVVVGALPATLNYQCGMWSLFRDDGTSGRFGPSEVVEKLLGGLWIPICNMRGCESEKLVDKVCPDHWNDWRAGQKVIYPWEGMRVEINVIRVGWVGFVMHAEGEIWVAQNERRTIKYSEEALRKRILDGKVVVKR